MNASTSRTFDLVRRAILERQQIVATFGGHEREFCPHVLGTKHGREQALVYQFGGTTSSGTLIPGSSDNWRCIPLDGLSDVRIRPGPWHTGDNYSPRQSCVDEIDEQVQPLSRAGL